jgi:hypothetical protein
MIRFLNKKETIEDKNNLFWFEKYFR